jgi:hypothetical protein
MLVVGTLIGEEKVGDIGVTRKGFLGLVGGEIGCGGPTIDAMCFIKYRTRMRKHKLKTTGTSVPENSSGALLAGCGVNGCWILRIITFFRRRTKKITRTAATIAMMPAKVPAIIGTEEDTFGSVGSESRVVVDAADVDCNTGVADIAALFIGENNPVLAGVGTDVVFDLELQTDAHEISIR